MLYSDISDEYGINPTKEDRVSEIVASLLEKGWQGAPILYTAYGLLTGSHRLEALKALDAALNWNYQPEYGLIEAVVDQHEKKIEEILASEVAVDVTEIVDAWTENTGLHYSDIDFSNIGGILRGTWVEMYKEEIVEW